MKIAQRPTFDPYNLLFQSLIRYLHDTLLNKSLTECSWLSPVSGLGKIREENMVRHEIRKA